MHACLEFGAGREPNHQTRVHAHSVVGMNKTWLSLQEAADELGVSTKTVRRRIADGTIPAQRIKNSRLIRIRAEVIDDLLRPIPNASA